MSSPTTPSRSRSLSTVSTPSDRASKSPIVLTPRSKVRALCAAFSDDSDDGNEQDLHVKPTIASTKPVKPVSVARHPAEDTARELDSEEEDVVSKPRGRMAARMLGNDAEGSSDENGRLGGDGAYERVKRQLLASKSGREPQSSLTGAAVSSQQAESSSDDQSPSNLTLNKRKAVRAASTSPVSQPEGSPSPRPSPSRKTTKRASPRSSPAIQAQGSASDSDSDLPEKPQQYARFLELVARKRAERKAAVEAARKSIKDARKAAVAQRSRAEEALHSLGAAESDSDDNGVRRRLTQQARPTRKASKKALEEMNRETQRMSRNMQLAHQAKTIKKFTTADLFKRFNFRQEQSQLGPETQKSDVSGMIDGSADASSDVEGERQEDTPPTSPPACHGSVNKQLIGNGVEGMVGRQGSSDVLPLAEEQGEDLPTLEDVLAQPISKHDKGKVRDTGNGITQSDSSTPGGSVTKQDKGKGPAVEKDIMQLNLGTFGGSSSARSRALRAMPVTKQTQPNDSESDDNLEIVQSRIPVFDRLPAKKAGESHSLLTLRALANLRSPGKNMQKGRASMTLLELQASLQERARQQARREKEERLDDLRARGIIVQTEEEREKDQLELENLLEKARKEAQEIAKKEKNAAKRNGEEDAGGEQLMDDEDDEEDGDWEGSGEEEDGGVELSGSEDEDKADEDGSADEELMPPSNGLLDNEADESDDAAENVDDGPMEVQEEVSDEEHAPEIISSRSRPRNRHVIADDEDDEEPAQASTKPSSATQRSLGDGMAAFGFGQAKNPSLGLTQMFAGTMADLQTQPNDTAIADNAVDPVAFLRELPSTTLPNVDASMADASQGLLIQDSQNGTIQETPKRISGDAMSAEATTPHQLQRPSPATFAHTQMSEMPDPTQDGGFEVSRSPALAMTAPRSTIDTVILPVPESPIMKRKGRLIRGRESIAVLSDVDEDEDAVPLESDGDEEFEISANAFDVMRKAAKKPVQIDTFDKKKSEAKGMVEEQAEESEDEYAGLGGASDDESAGDVDEEVAQMIDESEVNVDERKIAALYADKERAADERAIDKLYKDLTTGALRRKRGADFDLSDSDDDGAERRRRKQREFAKMRKALLEDENIGKIATNPKKLAFLRAIEDRDDDEDLDFLNAPEEVSQPVADSQGEVSAEQLTHTDSQPTTVNPLKRRLPISSENDENRPPPHHRRTAQGNHPLRAPTTLAQIRETVSFLIEDPHSVPDSQSQLLESDSDPEADNAAQAEVANNSNSIEQTDVAPQPNQRLPFSARRTAVVDRLSILRAASTASASADAAGAGGALAFHAPGSAASATGFKIPSLLRRATTALSALSNGSSGANSPASATIAAGGGNGGGVKMGGSRKSSIHYQAREAERRRAVEAAEKRRREGVKRKVVGQGRRGVLVGVLGGRAVGGGFE